MKCRAISAVVVMVGLLFCLSAPSARAAEVAPVQIVVKYKDDTFALFDADGNSQSEAVQSAETGTTAPPDPESIPPAPTSAPGK